MQNPPVKADRPNQHDPPARQYPGVETANKVEWIEIGKGLGTVQVVWFHVATIATETASPSVGLNLPIDFLRMFTHSYNMPFFFFLSGIFANNLLKKSRLEFISTVGGSIVYPYFVWSALQALILARFGLRSDHRAELVCALCDLLTEPHVQFWYLFVLFIFVCLYYSIARWRAGKLAVLLMGLILSLLPFQGVKWVFYQAQIQTLYYMLGAMTGPILLKNPFRSSLKVVIGLIGVLMISQACLPTTVPRVVELAFGVTGATAMILLARAIELAGGNRCLEILGRHSLKIYLTHMIGVMGMQAVLLRLGVTSVEVYLVLGMSVGLFFPLLVVHLAAQYHFSFIFKLKGRSTVSPSVGLDSSGEIPFHGLTELLGENWADATSKARGLTSFE